MKIIIDGKAVEIPGGGGDSSGSGNPVGTVISFLGLTAPAGYLVCDGTAYNISDYPVLAAFIETQFGTKNHFGGDGTTTFAVPDMRNLFLRGYHGEAEEQFSGEVGARQEATQIPVMWTTDSNIGMPAGNILGPKNYESLFGKTNVVAQGAGTYTASTEYDQLFTSRPVNMAVLYCIKAVERTSGGGSSGGVTMDEVNQAIESKLDEYTPQEVYSTEGTRIGTWIDGKPLYRITISSTLKHVLSQDINLPSGLNIETVTSIYGCLASYNDNFEEINSITVAADHSFGTQVFPKLNVIRIYSGSSLSFPSDAPINVSIEYTKTTD